MPFLFDDILLALTPSLIGSSAAGGAAAAGSAAAGSAAALPAAGGGIMQGIRDAGEILGVASQGKGLFDQFRPEPEAPAPMSMPAHFQPYVPEPPRTGPPIDPQILALIQAMAQGRPEAFKHGGVDKDGGVAMVGEDGPELVVNPPGTAVLPVASMNRAINPPFEVPAPKPMGPPQLPVSNEADNPPPQFNEAALNPQAGGPPGAGAAVGDFVRALLEAWGSANINIPIRNRAAGSEAWGPVVLGLLAGAGRNMRDDRLKKQAAEARNLERLNTAVEKDRAERQRVKRADWTRHRNQVERDSAAAKRESGQRVVVLSDAEMKRLGVARNRITPAEDRALRPERYRNAPASRGSKAKPKSAGTFRIHPDQARRVKEAERRLATLEREQRDGNVDMAAVDEARQNVSTTKMDAVVRSIRAYPETVRSEMLRQARELYPDYNLDIADVTGPPGTAPQRFAPVPGVTQDFDPY